MVCLVHRKQAARKTLVAVASWNASLTSVVLEVDWAAIGMDPSAAAVNVTAPAIEGFQNATDFGLVGPGGTMPAVEVAPAKGWLLVLQQLG